jgi:CDP-glucose 4,6-dehydratase
MFANIYQGKRVLITGHTGFKGSWLALWLTQLGAEVAGYALPPPTMPNHLELLNLKISSVTGNILDKDKLLKAFIDFEPEIVFHLAAQPLVRRSYDEPAETFAVNVLGTANVLDACRKCSSVRAIVNVTSDKCYENKEWVWGYRENDPMGGYDPYSASKGCAELVAGCYRNSFFNPAEYGIKHQTLIASCRAGNVIGGGDWAADRLIPDIIKAAAASQPAAIRNPNAIRPWQHVLEPLSGYLLVGQKLLEGNKEFSGAWNFGPGDDGVITVGELTKKMAGFWPDISIELTASAGQPHEAKLLKLDCSKAAVMLQWRSVWDNDATIAHTVNWYRAFYQQQQLLSRSDLDHYLQSAAEGALAWTK